MGLITAAAHRPEPVLPLAPGMKSAASESPTRPQRAGTSRAPKPRTTPDFEESPRVSPALLARYDREELYIAVWALTMQKAAKKYGVSDVALGKTCRKLHIPVPGKGYWNKRAANQPVEPRPPLPVIPPTSQPSEDPPQQAIARISLAGLPQTARPESQRTDGPECNQPTPASPPRSSQTRKPGTIPPIEKPSQVSPVLMARYDRKELYDKVWAMPVRIMAKEYGVSNVAIAKTCRKLHVPVPGTGYWAKKAANRPVEPRPPLPQLVTRT